MLKTFWQLVLDYHYTCVSSWTLQAFC